MNKQVFAPIPEILNSTEFKKNLDSVLGRVKEGEMFIVKHPQVHSVVVSREYFEALEERLAMLTAAASTEKPAKKATKKTAKKATKKVAKKKTAKK